MKSNEIVNRQGAAEIRRHENHHGFCSHTQPSNSSTSNSNPTEDKLHKMGAQGTTNIANYAHNWSQSNPITGPNFPNNSFTTTKFKTAGRTTLSRPHNHRKYTRNSNETQHPQTKFPNNIGRSSPADHAFKRGGTDGDRSTKNWPPKNSW